MAPQRPPEDEPVLPDVTSDEREAGWGDESYADPASDDDRYLRERPPHHEG